ncbi:hypothetical protein U732_4096 [Clostridium argentinense CDC 2741]|uniref:DUF1963 domain-containing protein n=1 Tax=Clostridium argentinense CDC 2741 TaxID=1418104 RepID=A0A0C1U9L0_9CLOT|nr:YwqG family protein [Clostridium argentinense]ARC84927.1 hypothetical protein RSJ17_10560 [Clostridium argentinense]KIE48358.1 hypothetical protein U732_4096 [Clostridium argentinense CDC 2741]NFF40694.1 DUF1963 domain-containing protein [Clostridium argentinense]NFP52250.1 DUF1963 domain-containing protein [Clostridium argentinense]NFP73863.1 DUF1963 domain-containing protein [Clostridium argentinense]
MKNIQLSKEFNEFKDIIQSTLKSTITIYVKEQSTKLWESKIGGNPYLEIGSEYPKNSKGEYLRLLSQINFEEVPHIEPYPKKGILQFFIFSDDFYGANFDNIEYPGLLEQDNFKIIYIADVIKDETNLVKDFSFLGELKEDEYLPLTGEMKMSFNLEKMFITANDYKFEEIYKNCDFDNIEDSEYDSLLERYYEEIDEADSRIGGYPNFTQWDPRANYKEYKDFDTLLLQLDIESDGNSELMFGDSGIANFFIREEDLKNLDFSKVMYTWDCC